MSERRPLSLNERHNRVLQHLSASRPRDPHPPPPSYSSEDMKTVKVKIDGRRRLCKASYVEPKDENAPEFSGFSDFDSPASFKEEESEVKVNDVSEARDSDFCGGEEESGDPAVDDEAEIEAPRFSILSDLDSDTPVKNSVDGNEEEKGDIRDILNELSAKMDLLSVEKPRVAKGVLQMSDSLDVAGTELGKPERSAQLLDHEGPSASFHNASQSRVDKLPTELKEKDEAVRESKNYTVGENYDGDSLDVDGDKVGKHEENAHFMHKDVLSSFHNAFNASQNRVDEISTELKVSDEAVRESKNNIMGKKYYDAPSESRSLIFKAHKRSVMKSKQSSVVNVDDNEDDECTILSGSKFGKGSSRHPKIANNASSSNEPCDIGDDDDAQSIVISGPKSTYTLPGKIAKMLYPHQRDGLRWLWSLHCQGKGGILGDDMGLGKTMQICGFLAGLFTSRLIKRVLIVAPKTLLPHWLKELSVVGLSKKTRDYFGTCSKAREYELQYILQDKGVLLTTYDIVRNNAKSLSGANYYGDELGDETVWDYMILDEGHLIKNPSTQRAKSLLEIPSAHRIIISGTPIQNNLKELWALFNFCCPDLLGDKNWFKHKYEHHILRGNDKNATDREKRIGSAVAKELREFIQPYFLRRLKSEVFNQSDDSNRNSATLSTKNELIVWLKLTARQRRLYEAFLNTELVLSAFDGSPLAALTILKKICDHPLLLTRRAAEDILEGMDSSLNQEELHAAEKLATHIADANDSFSFQDEHDNMSCKISFILALLDTLIPDGHNVLIFSQTRKMLNLIEESLLTRGYAFQRIDGTTKPIDRLKIVNDFQDGLGAPIFLLTSQVGGLGLTLTKADRVIVVDPAWNPSTDNQSVDRAYRIGQTKDVIVYRLMTSGTVEEKIYRKQVFKGGLFKTATEHKEQIRYFSQQDLRELFSLPKDGFDVSVTQQQLQAEHGHQHNMNELLKEHVNFLESLGIAGISNHSLLFSKTAPVQVPQEGDELERLRETAMYYKNTSSISFVEPKVDGAAFAFKPKDIEHKKNLSNSGGVNKLTESDIKQKLHRLSVIYSDTNTVSRLPDRGEKIRKQIADLNVELHKLRMSNQAESQVIDLDDLTEDLQRKVYV